MAHGGSPTGGRTKTRQLQRKGEIKDATGWRRYRFKNQFPQHKPLIDRVRVGVPFENALLSSLDVDALVQMNDWYRPGLLGPLRQFNQFVCVEYTLSGPSRHIPQALPTPSIARLPGRSRRVL